MIDGSVYGHGVMDMKAALACQIVAIEAVRASGLPVRGTLRMAAVADHMGDQLGSIAYFDASVADLCVLGELTDNQVCLGHRGRYYFDVTTRGRSAHTCHKDQAINANVLAAHAVLALEASKYEPELEPWIVDLFGPETYIVPGRIYGAATGRPSMIPDECVIRVDCRPQPGVTIEDVRAEIDRCSHRSRGSRPTLPRGGRVGRRQGYLAAPEDEVVRLMRAAVREVRGEDPPLVVENWLGDTASFGGKVPTVIFGRVVLPSTVPTSTSRWRTSMRRPGVRGLRRVGAEPSRRGVTTRLTRRGSTTCWTGVWRCGPGSRSCC